MLTTFRQVIGENAFTKIALGGNLATEDGGLSKKLELPINNFPVEDKMRAKLLISQSATWRMTNIYPGGIVTNMFTKGVRQ